MTWYVLNFWYKFHMSRFQTWEARKYRWDKKKWKLRANAAKRQQRIYSKREYHRFWLHNYCELMSAYGHEIVCVHFGEGENTIQSNQCPYKEDWCATCNGKIELRLGRWQHYLTYYDDCVTPRNDHQPIPKCEHWPHSLITKRSAQMTFGRLLDID